MGRVVGSRGARDKRVGLVRRHQRRRTQRLHGVLACPSGRGRHGAGAGLALAGAAVSSVGAYLGGHLVEARKVASHPAYDAALQA